MSLIARESELPMIKLVVSRDIQGFPKFWGSGVFKKTVIFCKQNDFEHWADSTVMFVGHSFTSTYFGVCIHRLHKP